MILKKPEGDRLVQAQRVFGGALIREEMREAGGDRGPQQLSFTAIYQCVNRRDNALDGPNWDIISTNLQYRRIYQDLVRKQSLALIEDRAAAASDGDISIVVNGYHFEVKTPEQQPQSTYIFIKVPEGRPAPSILELLNARESDDDELPIMIQPVELPPAHRGTIQMIKPSADPLILALREWHQNIVLR